MTIKVSEPLILLLVKKIEIYENIKRIFKKFENMIYEEILHSCCDITNSSLPIVLNTGIDLLCLVD